MRYSRKLLFAQCLCRKRRDLLQLEFDSLEKMAKAVPIIVRTGASACELMDNRLIGMAIEHLPSYRDILPANAVAALLVEHTGETPEEVKDKIKTTDSAIGNLVSNRTIVFDEQAQKRLWKARKDAVPLLDRGKGKKKAGAVYRGCVGRKRQTRGIYRGAAKNREEISILR